MMKGSPLSEVRKYAGVVRRGACVSLGPAWVWRWIRGYLKYPSEGRYRNVLVQRPEVAVRVWSINDISISI
jgi:hypothetical protein